MSNTLRVMVVDDEEISRVTALQQLSDNGYFAETAENAFVALEKLERNQWDVLVIDMRMPGMDGLELLQNVKKRFSDVDVIMITAYGTIETAVTAIQEGAADYLTKPFQFAELDFRLQKLRELRATSKEISTLRAFLNNGQSYYGLVGQSLLMKSVYESIQTFSNNTVPVLITGETGTGKELVARALHLQGDRSSGPFVAVACGAIPRELAESEFFGHEKGAFTNAINRKLGYFERAQGGTLLLDDVDDLPPEIQAKLLRVLQEGNLLRVGGGEEIQVNVRVIATTKKDLNQVVAEGQFREDLFYRLRGLEIYLPSLKERGEDVLLLAQHFLQLLDTREKKEPKGLSIEAADALRHYHWPGNVRELRRAIESAFAICRTPEIRLEHLPKYVNQHNRKIDPSSSLFTLHLEHCDTVSFNGLVQQIENTLIQWALTKANGHQSQAANLLSLPRTTFLSKIGPHKKE